MLEDFGQSMPLSSGKRDGFLVPKVDVAETAAGLELTAELPVSTKRTSRSTSTKEC